MTTPRVNEDEIEGLVSAMASLRPVAEQLAQSLVAFDCAELSWPADSDGPLLMDSYESLSCDAAHMSVINRIDEVTSP